MDLLGLSAKSSLVSSCLLMEGIGNRPLNSEFSIFVSLLCSWKWGESSALHLCAEGQQLL